MQGGVGGRTAPIFSLAGGGDAAVKLGGTLGGGTLARVDAAEWLGLPVAIKRLRPLAEIADLSTRARAEADFANEARVNFALGYHPNVVYVSWRALPAVPSPAAAPAPLPIV
jgi:hypothetical protein